MKHLLTALAATTSALVATPAAAAVTYTVNGSFQADTDGDTIAEIYLYNFVYTAPTFITSLTQATPTSCSVSGTFYQCAATSTFDPGSTGFGPPLDDDFFSFQVDNVDMTGGGGSFYFFQGGAFGAPGVYSNAGQPDPSGPLFDEDGDQFSVGNAGPATLTVSVDSTPPAVPEPAGWALMILGFGGGGAALRRTRRRIRYA